MIRFQRLMVCTTLSVSLLGVQFAIPNVAEARSNLFRGEVTVTGKHSVKKSGTGIRKLFVANAGPDRIRVHTLKGIGSFNHPHDFFLEPGQENEIKIQGRAMDFSVEITTGRNKEAEVYLHIEKF